MTRERFMENAGAIIGMTIAGILALIAAYSLGMIVFLMVRGIITGH